MNDSLRLVLDTNVVLDWLVFDDPRMAAIDAGLERGSLTLVSDALCLAELEDVLLRPAIRADTARRRDALARYRRHARMAELAAPNPNLPICRDPDDQPFLDLAARSGCRLLVTRDGELLRLDDAMRRAASVAVLDAPHASEEFML